MDSGEKDELKRIVACIAGIVGCVLFLLWFFCILTPNYFRWQAQLNAENVVQLNRIIIAQTEQKIAIEQQEKQIRIVEAEGIAAAQKIINATLTDKYLQHEAIEAQKSLVDSPNHTTVYIPSGQNGLPLVKTIE